MDTNDLSSETHKAVLLSAEKFHADLPLPFGVMAVNCESDDEFLDQSETLIKNWLNDSDLDDVIDDVFYENLPKKKDFKDALKTILKNIDRVNAIPMEKRQFEVW